MTEPIEGYGPKLGTREHALVITEGRHPDIRSAMLWLTFSHLPAQLQRFSAPFYLAAVDLLQEISSDAPELTTSLNKLIEAKDSGVRAGIRDQQGEPGPVPRPQTVVDPPFGGNYGPGQPRIPGSPALRPIQDWPQA